MSSAPVIEKEESVLLMAPAKKKRNVEVLMLHGWAQNAWVFSKQVQRPHRVRIHAGYNMICAFLRTSCAANDEYNPNREYYT
jgi:hypothetical protein